MDIRGAKVPFVLYAGNSHPELAKLIAEYVSIYVLINRLTFSPAMRLLYRHTRDKKIRQKLALNTANYGNIYYMR